MADSDCDVIQSERKIPIEKVFCSKGRITILKILTEEGRELDISEIVKRSGLHRNSVRHNLYILVNAKLVQEKKFIRTKYYCLKFWEKRVQAIKHFFDVWESSEL